MDWLEIEHKWRMMACRAQGIAPVGPLPRTERITGKALQSIIARKPLSPDLAPSKTVPDPRTA